LANPNQATSTATSTSTSSSNASNKNGKNNKRKASTQEKGEEKEKEKKQKDKEQKQCQYHPSSTTHTTAECRMKEKQRPDHSSDTAPAPVKSKTEVPPASSVLSTPIQTRARQRMSANQQQDLSKVQCFKCRKYGHYASTCTHPATGQPSSTNRSTVNSRRMHVQRPQVSFKDEDETTIPSTSPTVHQE
jgi:hypothetical protein